MSENIPFEKKDLIIKVRNPNHLPTIDFHKLKDLQGDLKITTPAKIEKLKNSVIKYGFFTPKSIWIDNSIHYIEDGHQTIKALTELEKEGYTVPPIPYVEIEAKDRKDAGEKLLMINSRFADINPETTFFKDFDIELEFMDEIEIPELELDLEEVEGADDATEHARLNDKFICPPFSVLDTRQGYWQERKRAWIALGIKGELGREDELNITSLSTGEYSEKNKIEIKIGKHLTPKEYRLNHSTLTAMHSTSLFDPVLSELGCKWFCTEKGNILNPMCGESVMGVVAGYLGYAYTGIDIREEQIKSNKEQTDKILKGREGSCTWLLGDGMNVDKLYESDKADFIFSCPPYYDLEIYSDDKKDISALQTYDEFITQYQTIITKSVALLNDNRFACFVVSDIRDKEGFYRNFVSDTIKCFINAGMLLYNEMILIHVAGSLPIRVAQAFKNRKVGKMHENVLVFFKGDPKTIKDNYKEIQVEWDDTYQ